jgi:hypothetical protein
MVAITSGSSNSQPLFIPRYLPIQDAGLQPPVFDKKWHTLERNLESGLLYNSTLTNRSKCSAPHYEFWAFNKRGCSQVFRRLWRKIVICFSE